MIQFKDVKQNYPVYILDKQKMEYNQGKVLSVSFPHMDNSNPAVIGKTVVDVVIEAGGKNATYAIPENMGIAYAGDIVISTDKDGIIHEVEAIKNNSEQYLNNVDKVKQDFEKSTELLAELNPILKEKQENEKRFSKIELAVEELGGMMKTQQDMLSKLIDGLKK